MPQTHVSHSPRYLLIKCWGFGFWSNVAHVVGQLLLCELTGRIPVIHWGGNCLFGGSEQEDGFRYFFEPVSPVRLSDLRSQPGPYFPAKWTAENLGFDNINKMRGPCSRMEGWYFLKRPEAVAVSDFFTGVVDLLRYIPPSHRFFGSSVDHVYRELVRAFLRPREEIVGEVERFWRANMAGGTWVGVHVRGSDKARELPTLSAVNAQYETIIDGQLEKLPEARIFLLTDDQNVLESFRRRYGSRMLCTSVTRTEAATGVHYQPHPDRVRLGREVMVDTYLATRCHRFIGNGYSNLSAFVPFLRDWPEGDCTLLGRSLLLTPNVLFRMK